jgi:hypothetical protein
VAQIVGQNGVDGGWAINDAGAYDFPYSLYSKISLMAQMNAGWVRLNFRLGAHYHDWTTSDSEGKSALDQYDVVVNACLAEGLRILGLISNETWPGNQSNWCAGNAENGQGNGDNPYLQALTNAFGAIANHYSGSISDYEIWNEPNAWNTHPSSSVYLGSSFMYPSNFAWLLHHVYNARPSGMTIISGGLFGQNIGGQPNPGDAYLRDTYRQGKALAKWGDDLKTYGSYPLDAIGQHIYVDQSGSTSATTIKYFLDAVHNAASQNEPTPFSKPTVVTEIGWNTTSVSENTQASNLDVSFGFINQTTYVTRAFWFNTQDTLTSGFHWGTFHIDSTPKPSVKTFQQRSANYMDQSINDHWNSFFRQLQQLFPNQNIQLPNTGTGIYGAWYKLYVSNKQLGPATSYEYKSVDWSGNPIVCQDFGSWRCEWQNGNARFFGPSGSM